MTGPEDEAIRKLAQRVGRLTLEDATRNQAPLHGNQLIKAHADFIHDTLRVVDGLKSFGLDIKVATLRNMFAMLDGDMDRPWIVLPQSEFNHDKQFEAMIEETEHLSFLDQCLKDHGRGLEDTITFAVFPLISKTQQRSLAEYKRRMVSTWLFDITLDLYTTFRPYHLVVLQCETDRMDLDEFKKVRGDWYDRRAGVMGSSTKYFRKAKTFGKAEIVKGWPLLRTMGINPYCITDRCEEKYREPFVALIDRCFHVAAAEPAGGAGSGDSSPRRKLRMSACLSTILTRLTIEEQPLHKPVHEAHNVKHPVQEPEYLSQSTLDNMTIEKIRAVCEEVLAPYSNDTLPPPLMPACLQLHQAQLRTMQVHRAEVTIPQFYGARFATHSKGKSIKRERSSISPDSPVKQEDMTLFSAETDRFFSATSSRHSATRSSPCPPGRSRPGRRSTVSSRSADIISISSSSPVSSSPEPNESSTSSPSSREPESRHFKRLLDSIEEDSPRKRKIKVEID